QDKPEIKMITEGGIIGKIGCNNAGVGVCLNALLTGTWEAKVPIHIGLRKILDSYSFDEAVSAVNNNQIASPANFLIASSDKRIIDLEVSPIYTAQIDPVNGMLVHTNHICSPALKNVVAENATDESYNRFNVMDSLLKSINND